MKIKDNDYYEKLYVRLMKAYDLKRDNHNQVEWYNTYLKNYKYKDNYKKFIYGTFNNNEIDHLVDKNILTKTVDNRYSMILSHKLFPNMKKSSENKILINDIDDRYFISRFVFDYNATNQSGKKLYSTVKLFHMYKFLKI